LPVTALAPIFIAEPEQMAVSEITTAEGLFLTLMVKELEFTQPLELVSMSV